MGAKDYRTKPTEIRRRLKIERRLAAVLAADILGYSALMGQNEEDTHRRVGADLARVTGDVERSRGRIFAFAGDGLVAEFPSAVEALKCALRIQNKAARRNARLPPGRRISYRIGINSGEIIVEGDRTGGNTVNLAARLEQLGKPGGICMSAVVYDQVRTAVPGDYVFTGEHRLKNIREPVAVYELLPVSDASGRPAATPRPHGEAADIADRRPSLAVLPFHTLRSGGSDTYFASGMVDDIIRVLGSLQHLIVVSRSSTLSYGRSVPDLPRIGRELDVQYVLHGSVRRAGREIRIAVELDDAATRQTVWADRFDGAVSNIFEMQDSISVRTAGSIAPHLRERELHRALSKDEDTITAYDLVLRALDNLYRRDRRALTRAEELLKRAIVLDPASSTTLSHLAYLHLLRIAQGWSHDDHAERLAAFEAARRALERDGSNALALAIAGHLTGYLGKNHDAALEALDRAVALGPSCALAWTFGSFTCGIMGDVASALERARKAVRLSPIGPEAGPWHEHALSQAHYLADNYEEAITWGRLAANHGGQASNLRCLAASLVAADQIEEARAVAQRILAANPSFQLGFFRAYTPLKGRVADTFVDRLRRAGLPD